MKACIIQPYYSVDPGDMESCFNGMLSLIDRCDESMDLIVLPEYCDMPANTPTAKDAIDAVNAYRERIYQKVVETARRCHAIVFANMFYFSEDGWRNTTYAFDREGREVGTYFKAHPAPSEERAKAEGKPIDCSYSYRYEKPYTIEIEGIRFGFMTCYDFYMYENFAPLARQNVDIIIGCSHQRTDTHNALDLIGRFLSYNTNAYLVRSSVSLGEDSPICGCSMIVNPKGEVLADMKSRIGLETAEFDPHDKYYKPAGFGGTPMAHHEYIEVGRRPWLYRNGGSMMVPNDSTMPYPRICAHRGFSSVAPENSMPAFGAAVASGAEEIEFDLWSTKDGELVSSHDPLLDRTSTGTGNIWDYTLEELRQFDFGIKCNPAFAGLGIITFEEILQKFAGTVIFNIHMKIWDAITEDSRPFDPQYERIAGLLRQYDCEHHCYMMTVSDVCLKEFHEVAPDIHRCVGYNGSPDPMAIVDRAIALGCEKVQLFKPCFNQAVIDKARANGILCNLFWSDAPEEAIYFYESGIDTILTNDYQRVSHALRDHWRRKGITR